MIEKFISIKNIGRFRDCSPRGDVSFRKVNLIFAENGRGKTTLCAILRSLQSGSPDFIAERKTIGAGGEPSIQIRAGGNTISYSVGAWSVTHPEITIFDSVFVHENVYSGNFVDHDQKKNLYRIIVGAEGVQLVQRVDTLDGEIREANRLSDSKKKDLEKHLPQGVLAEAYLTWQPVEDIDAKIQEKSEEIASQQREQQKSAEIQTKGLLARIELPLFPWGFTDTLAKSLSDIAADAESCVKRQIARHEMGAKGESWLSQGLGYVKDDLCPYCGQDVRANDLIAAYRSHFNAAYKALKQEVAQLSEQVNAAIGENALATFYKTASNNQTLAEFWKQFTETALPDLPVDEVRRKYVALRERALVLAKKKQETPLDSVAMDEEITSAFADVAALRLTVDVYNAAIETCNSLISQKKASVLQGGNIAALKADLLQLEARKKRFEPAAVQACSDYQSAKEAKAALERAKDAAKTNLNRYCQDILQTYQRSINEYLDQFNTGYRIVNTQHSYLGGKPSAQFQIQINGQPVDLGTASTPAGRPCFKTTLSSGDRSALALAFFLAMLKQDPNVRNKIVILDDPFTSLDRFRRTCTQQLIHGVATAAKQVFVFSHDPHFLKLIFDAHTPSEVKSLQICKTGNNTMLGEWDIEAETQSAYLKNHSTLLAFYRNRLGDHLAVARAIRPFLEGLLRAHFPGRFPATEWLGDFITKIRDAEPTDGLQHAQADLGELEAINQYSRKYHHEQNPNADAEPISDDELHGFVKRTLKLVGD